MEAERYVPSGHRQTRGVVKAGNHRLAHSKVGVPPAHYQKKYLLELQKKTLTEAKVPRLPNKKLFFLTAVAFAGLCALGRNARAGFRGGITEKLRSSLTTTRYQVSSFESCTHVKLIALLLRCLLVLMRLEVLKKN